MLKITGLSSGYGGLAVLKDVSIHIRAGEFAAIVGPNGAGKTTLFKTISGTVPAMQGSIEFEGKDLLSIKPSARAHLGIAHIPEGRQVFPSLSILENLEMGAYTKAGQASWKENIEKIAEKLKIKKELRHEKVLMLMVEALGSVTAGCIEKRY